MKTSAMIVVASLLLVPALSHAGDRDRHFSGGQCMDVYAPGNGNYFPRYIRSGSGFRNYDAGAMTLYCPATYDLDSTLPRSNVQPSYLRLNYTDSNPTVGWQGDLWCNAEAWSENGGYTTVRRYACSQWGGCLNSTNGTFSGSFVYNLNFNVANGWINTVNFYCQVPSAATNGTPSSINYYQVDMSYQ